jgi:hypothetical protein
VHAVLTSDHAAVKGQGSEAACSSQCSTLHRPGVVTRVAYVLLGCWAAPSGAPVLGHVQAAHAAVAVESAAETTALPAGLNAM